MAKRPSKGVTRVRVERSRERPEPVKTVVKTRPAKKSQTPMADLIRQGIADRTFI